MGLGGSLGGLFYTGGLVQGNTIVPNYAAGSIGKAMARERAQSGENPMVALLNGKPIVVNDREIILSAQQSEKFRKLGLDRVVSGDTPNFAKGNLAPNPVSGGGDSGAVVTVPITINYSGGSDGPKDGQPGIDVPKLRDQIRGLVLSELQNQSRNGGALKKS